MAPPPRRSPRLQARGTAPSPLSRRQTVPPRPAQREPPRKRARPRPRPRPRPRQIPDHARISLLDLPDGPLTNILTQLGASNTGGSLRRPRDAFSLAQTNTRLLSLFSEMLKRVTPDVRNGMPATLSENHLLAVVRIAGQNLVQICLPSRCSRVVEALNVCPNLSSLSVIDDGFLENPAMQVLRRLSLRELSVRAPSRRLLMGIPRRLEELTLTMVSLDHSRLLAKYLRNPPKRLTLQLERTDGSSLLRDVLMDSLKEACARIEEVSISLHPLHNFGFERDFEIAASEAAKCMRLLRSKGNVSACKIMKLGGCALFRLLLCADHTASVELTSHGFTFGDDGDGLHVRRMPLCFEKPSCDLSRLREVFHNAVFRDITLCWRNTLSTINLKFAHVESLHSAKRVGLRTDVVEIPFWCLCRRSVNSRSYREKYWNWLSDVREVRLVEASHLFPRGAVECFLKILARVLDECDGEIVWIEPIFDLHVKYQRNRIRKIRPAYRAASAALKRYEERGGDAGTVRAVLAAMRWTGTPNCKQ